MKIKINDPRFLSLWKSDNTRLKMQLVREYINDGWSFTVAYRRAGFDQEEFAKARKDHPDFNDFLTTQATKRRRARRGFY